MDFEPEDIDDDSTLCPKSWRTETSRSTNLYAPWTKIVEQFTVSGLTKSSDKLYALSGVAERMRVLTGDNYVAGLWERNLLFDLLWYIEKGRQANWEPSYRISPSPAPSWSWASVQGRVHFAQGRLDIAWGPPLVEIRAIDIDSVTKCDNIDANRGTIIISGALEKMPELAVLPEYMFSMFPGAGSSCCMDDDEDLQTNDDLYALPMRAMKSVNGESLLCLILTPTSKNSEVFRRAGLLSLAKDELDDFEWADGEWHNGTSGLYLKPHVIRIQ
ncbi:uncharacterized protein Z520_04194 [Fonsecaea multimorphosa CBS 102226]|uniref:Heterokaryon incompatibility domain-containing protein n=1 Tax=Fonsecaea multimorphosa CBS 102226 TaxID=1442371 RepID=A0A0D2KUV1_9EURO|nr:uncharacterized protein Z520_04194 [Fonsecaea multimorphosa CBS 102226]KIY00509.1 hypothetical protein Z520_04194 [Fonsecaea multimorphosa CBS 102226]OAL27026.1 hypothetical protein AYO22_03970 [Fonsecaea multimorphosa]